MPKTSAERISERLGQAIDPELLGQYHKKRALVLGIKSDATTGGIRAVGDWPIFEDLRVQAASIGESRAVLETAYLHESRLRSSDPEPSFPQVGPILSETRKQVFLARSKDPYGEWVEDITYGFHDGMVLGRGGCEIHAIDSGEYQRTCLTHYPLERIAFDPFERNVTKSRFIGMMRLVRLEDAEEKWGTKEAQKHARKMRERGNKARALEVVPVTTYYDADTSNGNVPTRAIVLGNVIESKPVEIEESGLDFIPFAMCLGYMPGGTNEPIGSIDRMIAIQEAINEYERKMRYMMNRPDLLFIDPSQMDERDAKTLIAQLRSKGRVQVFKIVNPGGPGFTFVPMPGLTQADVTYGDRLDRRLAEASGLSEIDRGVALDKDATKYEVQQVQEATSLNSAGPQKMVLDYMRRIIDYTLKVAAVYDTEPLAVDVLGVNVALNVPEIPQSSLKMLMEEPSSVVVGTDSLTAADDETRRRKRYATIADVAKTFQGVVDPSKAAVEAIKSLKITDSPQDWVIDPAQQTGGVPGAPALPGAVPAQGGQPSPQPAI